MGEGGIRIVHGKSEWGKENNNLGQGKKTYIFLIVVNRFC